MDVRIHGWRYQDIRGVGSLDIDLGDNPPRWTLIQMPNGTGKTTTLTLMRLALSNESAEPKVVRALRPDDKCERGEFELKLTVDGTLHRLIVRLDYVSGTLTRWTARAATEAGGQEQGRLLPHELQLLLTAEFTRLFIFDGELAKAIRDINRQEAVRAIRTLYRLDRIETIKQAIERLVANRQAAAEKSSAKSRLGLANVAGRFQTAKEKLEELKASRKLIETTLGNERTRIDTLKANKAARLASDENVRRESQETEAKLAAVEKEVIDLSKAITNAMRNPAAISERIHARLVTLGSNLQQLKLPKTTSAEFFYELAERAECICGRTIGPDQKKAIIERAVEFLAENQVGVINAMKHALRTHAASSEDVRKLVETLASRDRERARLQQRRDQIEVDKASSGDEELRELIAELSRLMTSVQHHEERLRILTTKSRAEQQARALDWKSNIPLCENELRDRRRQLDEATETVALRERSDFVSGILSEVETRTTDFLQQKVRDATNAKLKELLPSELITVKSIRGALELSSARLSTKEAVSEGQSLAVAYAFLSSLFEDVPYRLPFVVDSPAVSLDVRVRREVAELIPDLFNQVIFFVISSERAGFADAFYTKPGARLMTIWRDGDFTEVRHGIEVFREFHSVEDEKVAAV